MEFKKSIKYSAIKPDNHLNILYCSSVCSEGMVEYLFKSSVRKPLLSIQKFHRLFIEGLIINNCRITALSAIPVSSNNHKRLIWTNLIEISKKVTYRYLPFINLPFIRQSCIFVFSFLYTSYWCITSRKKQSLMLFDVLNVAISVSGLAAARLFGFKTCGIVTDLPDMIKQKSSKSKSSLFAGLASFAGSKFITSYDHYIILTKQMNEVVNIKKKPYLVMEGLVDAAMNVSENLPERKAKERILLYSGGIYEKYGIKNLIEAFIKLSGDDLRLHIYGSGEMENVMPRFTELDERIVFHGVVPNNIVVERQKEATLLINPRPTNQEFTKYSFPSKNMEYMVSGTPLVTTCLPGMPREYRDYVFLFTDETVQGLYETLRSLMNKSGEELHGFGTRAKEFVLEKKNNIIQAEKFLQSLNYYSAE